jgi:outer membrane immunogenic protein
LLYATGGLAIRDNRGGGGITNGGALPATFFANVDGAAAAAGVTASGVGRNNFGGAVGGGIEHAFSNNLSAKVEGLWLLFGGNTSGRVVGVTNMGAPINTSSSDNDLGIVRVGLNWKLGGFAAR